MDSAGENTKPAKMKEALAQYVAPWSKKKKKRVCSKLHVTFNFSSLFGTVKVKVKVKFTLEQATKARRGSRGIALLFLQPRH